MRTRTGNTFLLFVASCCAGTSVLLAQDTLDIAPVSINARKTSFATTGRKVETVDSAFREQFRFGAVSELLNYHSVAHLRTYGGGGIAMAGLRGASVEQTAVLWNGMNLQNSMLGLTDLSLAPAVLFESAAVEYGSAASTWGSGAVGGSIHLDNRASFGKKFSVSTGISAGDIGQLNTSAVIHAGRPRFVNVTKVYTTRSRNEYPYFHKGNERYTTMERSAWQGHGVMNEMRALFGKHHLFSVNAWLSRTRRQIPGYDPSVLSSNHQNDGAMRFQGAWIFSRNRLRAQLRTAYFNEQVGFIDSLSDIRNNNRAQTFMTDLEQYYRLNARQQFHAGVSFLNTQGITENYLGPARLQRVSFLAGSRTTFFSDRLAAMINGRAEHFSVSSLPVTGSAALEFSPKRWIKAGGSFGTAYRQPTLNELYWVPGGNRGLLPERSRSADGHLKFLFDNDRLDASVTLAAFTRTVSDWILWTPGPTGQPTPMNIRKVWSRGTETTWDGNIRSGVWNFGLRIATSYVLSTVAGDYGKNSESEGKQLIYTPRYMSTGNIYAGYRGTRIYIMTQYAGYRFTTSDNTEWLDPYMLVSARLTQSVKTGSLQFNLYGACNNLLNTRYVVMEGRWMPLRYFELGITIQINKKTAG